MHKDERELDILVIEDNIGDYVLVEEFLSEYFMNCTLTHVETAAGARHELKNPAKHFDAVLLDLTLPDDKGEPLIQSILEDAENTPVIVLTGYSDLSFSIKSLSIGVSDYLLKDDLSPSLLHKSIIYSIERNIFSTKIKESEKNYRDLFDLSPEPIFLIDITNGNIVNVNKAATEHYGYGKEEFFTMTIKDINAQSDDKHFDVIKALKARKRYFFSEDAKHKKKNGELIDVEIHASGLDYGGKPMSIIMSRDVTEKREEEARLRLLESVITNSTEAVVILEGVPSNLQGRKILYVNEAFSQLTGYKAEEVYGRSLRFLNGFETSKNEIKKLKTGINNWEVCEVEFVNYKKDGSPFWINTTMVPVADESGAYTHWVAIGRDITERKKYETDLRQSLAEKEVLLAEIHHRVKNNLAVVSGMLQLQAIQENDKELEGKLHDSIFRVSTMATIHEILYQSGSFSRLNFSEIIYKLVQSIHSAMENDRDIQVSFEKKSIELNINLAIPCSLIVNEVITNIYKHAFKGRKRGSVTITLDEVGDAIELFIQDDGIGLPENFDPADTSTLGKHLIKILSNQLNADFLLHDNETGTLFSIKFAKSDVKGSGNALL